MIDINTEIQNPEVKTGYDMLYLVTCSLHGIVPKQNFVEQMDLSALYRISKKHSLTAIVCMALEAADVFSVCTSLQLVKQWKDTKAKAIRKNLMLDTERKEILSFMENKGIWYLPLKGIILKELYPKLGMREMADNDILYDKQHQKELMNFMITRGYEASQIGEGNHDIYKKAPIYNYELHTALYGKSHHSNWQEYYENVRQQLIKDEANDFGYHFSDEDFYIYITTHMYKHYNVSGTGFRSLLDIYVFLKQKELKLNWNYILKELEYLQIKEFEQENRELCKKLFSKKSYRLTEIEREVFTYYLGSGTYGTMKNRIEKKLRKYQPDNNPKTTFTKIKYYLERLIPDMNYYKNHIPFIYRHKWLIPFFLVLRVLRGIIRNRKRIQNEIQLVNKL